MACETPELSNTKKALEVEAPTPTKGKTPATTSQVKVLPPSRSKPCDRQGQGPAVTTTKEAKVCNAIKDKVHASITQTKKALEVGATPPITQVKVPPPTESKVPAAFRVKARP